MNKLEQYLEKRFGKIKLLASGCYNVNYLAGNKVIRVSFHSDMFEGDNLKKEYKVLKELNGLHAPKVYSYQKSKYSILVEEFIQGQKIRKLSDQIIKKIAKALAEIHLSKKSRKSQGLSKFYVQRLKRRLNHIKKNKTIHKQLSKYVVKALKDIKQNEKTFRKYQRPVFIHGDMHCGNMILRKNKIIFLDWENNAFADPAFDIVAFFYESENQQYFKKSITKKQKDLFIKEYLKYNPDDYLIHKIKIICPIRWLSDTLWLALRIVDYDKLPIKDKTKKEYIKLYNFNLKKLKEKWK